MKAPLRSALLVTTGLGLMLAACTTSPAMRKEVAQRIAAPSWMVERHIEAAPFSLTAYERMHHRFAPADIYIEGDGVAWVSRHRKSLKPTPINPVALHLASRDKAENIAWIARPCQYTGMLDKDALCDDAYWTGKRFAPEVLQAYNAALDDIKARYDIEGFNLVGFSGGGAIAALLAASRDDVLSFRTVAGNLDHRAHSAYHNVSPLEGSLNPPEFADKLATVPQVHFIGGQDEIVPPAVLHSYLQALGPTSCVQYRFIQEAAHDEGWVQKWPELLAIRPACEGVSVQTDIYEEIPEPRFITKPEKPEKP